MKYLFIKLAFLHHRVHQFQLLLILDLACDVLADLYGVFLSTQLLYLSKEPLGQDLGLHRDLCEGAEVLLQLGCLELFILLLAEVHHPLDDEKLLVFPRFPIVVGQQPEQV
jgi:hypothetical protein